MLRSNHASLDQRDEWGRSPNADDFSFRHYPFYLISRVFYRYSDDLNRRLKAIGLDQTKWRILTILIEEQPLSMSNIADLAASKLSTITRLTQRMESQGLVTFSARASDQRVTEVAITKKGREAYTQSRPLAARAYERAVAGLSDDDLAAVSDIFTRINQNYADDPA